MTKTPEINDADSATEAGRPSDPALILFVVLMVVMLVILLRALPPREPLARRQPSRATIDPNTAPWWELTVLPRIGEQTARKIVLYRESAKMPPAGPTGKPVFRDAGDLTQVRGLGPRTTLHIAPFLRFD